MNKFIQNKQAVLSLICCIAIAIVFARVAVSNTLFLALSILVSSLIAGLTVFWVQENKIDRLTQLSYTDPATGLYNSEVINNLLKYDIERSKRYQRDISVILLEVDNFDLINETYGRKKADDAFKTFSRIILQGIKYVNKEQKEFHGIRSSDIAFRYEGEDKVLIIMPETDAKGAYIAAERIREAVMFTPFNKPDEKEFLRITLSAGVVSFDSEIDTTETLLQRVNLLLLKAKITKNHVVIENPIHNGLVVFSETKATSPLLKSS
ncbi:MAG: diguanylate cyclase [Thiotrichaceae bacterium]